MVGHKILANNRRTKEARRHQSPGKAIKHFLGKMSSRAADSASCALALGAWKKGNCNCVRSYAESVECCQEVGVVAPAGWR